MADKIVRIDKDLKASDSTIQSWDICYEVEDSGDINTFVVNVKGDDMTDRTDQAEAESLANVKAKAIKDAWVAEKSNATNTSNVTETEKNVTL